MQRDIAFSASFNVLYLVDSEKSVTHTHTHFASGGVNIFLVFLYARVKGAYSPINKGSDRVPFVRFFVPFYLVEKGK